jgi:DMSO/TMAO reductase YedYZ molybdopterin-dependent catalytic subunit
MGCCASATAMLLQNLLRVAWQVRGIPERLMEWLLLFVPLDLFEQGLARFGADAKELALTAATVGMAASLAALGALAIRSRWRERTLLGLGAGMWLVTMLVFLPLTGAGPFGTALLVSPLLTSASYLVVFLGYASALMVGRLAFDLGVSLTRQTTPPAVHQRRALLVGLAGAALAGGAAALVGRQGGLVASSLPLASAPTPATPPQPQAPRTEATLPSTTAARQPASPRTAGAPDAAAPTPAATEEPFPNPTVSRRLTRDQDGSITAAGRPRGQLASPITTNDDFYVVTKNAVADPVVDAHTWRLVIDGEVNNPVQLDYRTLRALPAVEVVKTLECISNFTAACNLTSFGCDLLSTAQFRGARLSDVLALAGGLKSSAIGLAALSSDEFSAGLPVEVAQDPETLVVYEMNGEPLPREHGFPARLLVPGRYGMKNPKWLAGIRAMNEEYAGWYEQRNWNKDGIVKTMSRIDSPVDGDRLSPGPRRVAGVAYAGDRGVAQVEVTFDDGDTWQVMRLLEPMPGKDAMVRWEGTFEMPSSGSLTLTVRATDGTGDLQTDEFQLPQPDGASGRDSITVMSA